MYRYVIVKGKVVRLFTTKVILPFNVISRAGSVKSEYTTDAAPGPDGGSWRWRRRQQICRAAEAAASSTQAPNAKNLILAPESLFFGRFLTRARGKRLATAKLLSYETQSEMENPSQTSGYDLKLPDMKTWRALVRRPGIIVYITQIPNYTPPNAITFATILLFCARTNAKSF